MATARIDRIERIVLDTNVCLDLFVFGDPRCGRLRAALDAGEVRAICDTACRDEWRHVLAYPQLALEPARQAAALAAFDAWVIAPDDTVALEGRPPLPRCRDPHDQKFLELAVRGGARWLLSRDAALLALDRRMVRDAGVRIAPPWAWSDDPQQGAVARAMRT